MKKAFLYFVLIVLTFSMYGCQSQNEIKKMGDVANRTDFIITEFDSKTVERDPSNLGSSGLQIVLETISKLEEWHLKTNDGKSGEAAIVKCKVLGKSESFYKDYGIFINNAGDKESDIAAFTLTQLEILETYDGELIKKNDALVKKGDVITFLSRYWLMKNESGDTFIKKIYQANFPILVEDNIYILYMYKWKDGYEYEHAVMNNVWSSFQGYFILNNETRQFKKEDDVKIINLNEDKNKKYDYWLNPYLYPLVIEKYGQ